MTPGERMVFAASMAASADNGREPTLAVKAAAMAVRLLRSARDELHADGKPDRLQLDNEERSMLDEMLSSGGGR